MAWQPVRVPRMAMAATRRAARLSRWKDLAGIGVVWIFWIFWIVGSPRVG